MLPSSGTTERIIQLEAASESWATKAEIAQLEARMIKWVVATALATVVAMSAVAGAVVGVWSVFNG